MCRNITGGGQAVILQNGGGSPFPSLLQPCRIRVGWASLQQKTRQTIAKPMKGARCS